MRGLGKCAKRATIKRVICSFNMDMVLIQEWKLSSVKDSTVKRVMGSGGARISALLFFFGGCGGGGGPVSP